MTTVRALTSLKKVTGTLELTGNIVTWTPSVVGPVAPISIPAASIENLQATPATSAKVMVKIFCKLPNTAPDAPTESFVFSFVSPAAREEADVMKDALGATIAAAKATPVTAESAAAAAAAAAAPSDFWSTSKLQGDMELQMSLLKADPALSNTFKEAVMEGPITSEQFWSTRTHLLRAHALEKAQQRGPQNVLAAVRSTTVDGQTRISLSREQIKEIFTQHPLVKTVYDENVPRVTEDQFWSRFFLSRLFKKLKGDKLLPSDTNDNIFDRYLTRDSDGTERVAAGGPKKKRKIEHVPLTIDLAGNEMDVTRGRGNAPDLTMRPSAVENVPIIHTLNSLSAKLVDLVAPADPTRDQNTDETYAAGMKLADLADDDEEERIMLNIQDQRQFFASTDAPEETRFAGLDPATVLGDLRSQLGDTDFSIASLLPAADDDNDPDDPNPSGSFHLATSQITATIASSSLLSSSALSISTLPPAVLTSLTSVHSTTLEFLHHFWTTFLSAPTSPTPAPANLVKLANTLKNCKARIEAVAKFAEDQRAIEMANRKKVLQEEYKRTGIKPRKRDLEVGGGRKVVEELLRALERAVEKAGAAWEEAVREEAE
ncbi:hypothetical protein FPQ18DRAFT_285987 [Pyronema domesticum]|nr:hypothetical protein FPQ18DRAFT_285987 [Pyronema domesticum]